MSDETSVEQVQFSPDFAARVMGEADKTLGRRRWTKVAGISAATAVTAAMGLWSMQLSREQIPQEVAPSAQIANAGEFSWIDEAGQSDPLQWIFPDAQPVAQFADSYSDAMMGSAAQRQQLLFADESGQDNSL